MRCAVCSHVQEVHSANFCWADGCEVRHRFLAEHQFERAVDDAIDELSKPPPDASSSSGLGNS